MPSFNNPRLSARCLVIPDYHWFLLIASRERYQVPLALYESVAAALHRGIKIRLLVEKCEDLEVFLETINRLVKKGLELRLIEFDPPGVPTIFDKKEAIVPTLARIGVGKSDAIWSDCPSLVGILQDYFDKLWQMSNAPPAQA